MNVHFQTKNVLVVGHRPMFLWRVAMIAMFVSGYLAADHYLFGDIQWTVIYSVITLTIALALSHTRREVRMDLSPTTNTITVHRV